MTVVALFSCLLLACGKRVDVETGDSYIYSLNGERDGLVKISYQFTGKDTKEQAENILKELKKREEEIEYSTTIPKKVRVQECKIKDTIAYLDFNGEYKKLSSIEEKLIRAAVTQSLLQLPKVKGVYITVAGKELQDEDGTVVGILNEDDFVQNADSSINSYGETEVLLYFSNESGDGLVKAQRNVKYNSNESREKLIVEKLMYGPEDSSMKATINPNATLLGLSLKDGICYVNFDSEFLEGVSDLKPEITIYSLVNSLIEGTAANKVQITVNGEKHVTYMNTVDLSQPLQQNLDLIYAEEE